MTWNTQGCPIVEIVSQFRVRSPRQNMVNMKLAAALAAFLASIVVTLEDFVSKFCVFRFLYFPIPDCGMAALPVGMIGTNKMEIAGRNAPGLLSTPSNGSSMFFRKLAACQCHGDGLVRFLPGGWRHQVSLSAIGLGYIGELAPGFWALGWIVAQVAIRLPARMRAEVFISLATRETALYAR